MCNLRNKKKKLIKNRLEYGGQFGVGQRERDLRGWENEVKG